MISLLKLYPDWTCRKMFSFNLLWEPCIFFCEGFLSAFSVLLGAGKSLHREGLPHALHQSSRLYNSCSSIARRIGKISECFFRPADYESAWYFHKVKSPLPYWSALFLMSSSIDLKVSIKLKTNSMKKGGFQAAESIRFNVTFFTINSESTKNQRDLVRN